MNTGIMNLNSKYKNKEIEELLESDDELPTVYDEIPDIPAYQDGNRFASSRYSWKSDDQNSESSDETSLDLAEETSYTNTLQHNKDEKILLRKGFLNKQDIYCLKSIEAQISDTTLLWFVDYLMYKDMQSKHYNFIRNCLVGNIADHYNLKNEPYVCETNVDVKKYKLKLVYN